MPLEGLEAVLEMLRERSRFRLHVHPSDAEEASMAILKSHMVTQVRVVASPAMQPGDAYLLSSSETWQFRNVSDNADVTETPTQIGA